MSAHFKNWFTPNFAILLAGFLPLAVTQGGCKERKASAPAANKEIVSKQNETTAVEPSTKENNNEVKEEKGKHSEGEKKIEKPKVLPVLEGFASFSFGDEYKSVQKAKFLKERCKGRPFKSVNKKKFPSQTSKLRFIYCTAEIASRFAKMAINFDHEEKLYEVSFFFDNDYGGKVKKLIGDEVGKFVSDVRAVLEPTLGKPIDESTEGGISSNKYHLSWYGKTKDEPTHKTQVVLSMEYGGLSDYQDVTWTDTTRKEAMDKALESERTESIKSKGL